MILLCFLHAFINSKTFIKEKAISTECNEGCLECDESKLCTKAADGYFLETNENGELTGTVAQCSSRCTICEGKSDNCSSCTEGYGLLRDENGNSLNICSSCEDTNCKQCFDDSKKCTLCHSYYFGRYYGLIYDLDGKSTNICYECRDSLCLNCSTNYMKCLECKDGYGVKVIDDNISICTECSDPNCKSCSKDYNQCTECKSDWNYQYILVDGICTSCPENPFYCRIMQAMQQWLYKMLWMWYR